MIEICCLSAHTVEEFSGGEGAAMDWWTHLTLFTLGRAPSIFDSKMPLLMQNFTSISRTHFQGLHHGFHMGRSVHWEDGVTTTYLTRVVGKIQISYFLSGQVIILFLLVDKRPVQNLRAFVHH